MEEAWEFAAVSEGTDNISFLEMIRDFFEATPNLEIVGALLAVISLFIVSNLIPNLLNRIIQISSSAEEVRNQARKKVILSILHSQIVPQSSSKKIFEYKTSRNETSSILELQDLLKKLDGVSDQIESGAVSKKQDFLDASGTPISDWKLALIESRNRLIEETERLKSRSVFNLSVGLLFAFLGFIALIVVLFFLIPDKPPEGIDGILSVYISRVLLVVSIQVLSFFFLKMYVSNERDIKLNKSEITNIELKYTGALLASETKTSLKDLGKAYGGEDRSLLHSLTPTNHNSDEILKNLETMNKLVKELTKRP